VKSLRKVITGPQRTGFKILKKLQLIENDKLNINNISEDVWVAHYTKLWNEEK
jgi:hypothetical protein